MDKLLVERPRHGGGIKFQRNAQRTWQRIPLEDRPRHEAIMTRWRQSKVALKGLNENLAPLRRFLRSQLGRRWDEVRSEIAEHVDRASAVQAHIWQHIEWEVLTEPRKIEEAIDRGRRFGAYGRLYVDPGTGRLRAMTTPTYKQIRKAAPPAEPFLTVVDGRSYKRIDGVWYEVELAPRPPNYRPGWDAVLRKLTTDIPVPELAAAYGAGRFASRKRQLCSKEVRRLEAALGH